MVCQGDEMACKLNNETVACLTQTDIMKLGKTHY